MESGSKWRDKETGSGAATDYLFGSRSRSDSNWDVDGKIDLPAEDFGDAAITDL